MLCGHLHSCVRHPLLRPQGLGGIPRRALDARLPLRRPPAHMGIGGRQRALPHIPKQVGISTPPKNPALPPKSRTRATNPSRFRPPTAFGSVTDTLGVGAKRVYPDIRSNPPEISYPPRPIPGSVTDLDVMMKHCDFSTGKVPCTAINVRLVVLTSGCSMSVTAWRFSEWALVWTMANGHDVALLTTGSIST